MVVRFSFFNGSAFYQPAKSPTMQQQHKSTAYIYSILTTLASFPPPSALATGASAFLFFSAFAFKKATKNALNAVMAFSVGIALNAASFVGSLAR